MKATVMCEAVQPKQLYMAVHRAMVDGIDPKTGEYVAKWHDAKKDFQLTSALLKRAAEALDDLVRRGHARREWNPIPNNACRDFLFGS